MSQPTLYLDTCIVSGIAKADLAYTEQAAVTALLRAHKAGTLHLVTSEIAKREISEVPEQFRAPHETIYLLLSDVPSVPTARTHSGLTLMGVGGGRREDPTYASLKHVLPDETDANHVFQAIRAHADYFVTTDSKTILRFSDTLRTDHRIEAVLPTDAARQLIRGVP